MKWLRKALDAPLYAQILWGLVLAVILSEVLKRAASPEVVSSALASADFIGGLFLRALKMLVIPLIVSAVISAVARMGSEKGFGLLAGKTMLFYVLSSLVAILIGLAWVNSLKPGEINGEPAQTRFPELAMEDNAIMERVAGRGIGDVVAVVERMIPPNIIEAAAGGEMLGLIIFSILFGFFTSRLSDELRDPVCRFWTGVYEVMLGMTGWVMRFSALGVFALILAVGLRTEWGDVLMLFRFPLAVVLALATHAFVVMPLVLWLMGGVRPLGHLRAMGTAWVTAFSTASSSATLPVTMECLQNKAGVSRRVTHFTTPLGATVNMDGTALYECVAVVFLLQFFGMEIGLGTQFLIVTLALVTSIGVAGIPAASLVAILVILQAAGLPEAQIAVGVALLQFTDRLLDMCRTAVNVWGDSCCAVIVARSEGEATLVGRETAY
ncbi:MAG: dicarboxylate/amino acid:cation symporter [Candidatus Methylacidiphilales bacterium]